MTKGYHDHAELQERQRNMMKEFLDIIETTYDISDDVESIMLSRKLNDALSSRLFYAHFDSHRDISHFKSSCFCELFF